MEKFTRDICTFEETQTLVVQRLVAYFTAWIIVDQRIRIGYLSVWYSGL
jgi:hypothetical protein